MAHWDEQLQSENMPEVQSRTAKIKLHFYGKVVKTMKNFNHKLGRNWMELAPQRCGSTTLPLRQRTVFDARYG
jgi:hypothetical protein